MGLVELGLQVRLVAAAGAGAVGATALRHEAGDHAVELDAIVEAFAGQLLDARDMAGGQIGAQLDDNVAGAIAGVHGEGQKFVGHVCSLGSAQIAPGGFARLLLSAACPDRLAMTVEPSNDPLLTTGATDTVERDETRPFPMAATRR
jgi:hypothetical protein